MNTVTVEKLNSRWIARCSYEDRAIPKAAGFRWDPAKKQWFTTDAAVAAKLSDPESAARILAEQQAKEQARLDAVESSRASSCDIDLPVPDGLAYLPYQRAGIASAVSRQNVLFGDEMGLGKTIQAIGVINADPSLQNIVIVCPASLRLNWKRELTKWMTREARIIIAAGRCPTDNWDGLFRLAGGIAAVRILIINYDILGKWAVLLHSITFDMLCCDEAHYLKNPTAKRTQAVVGQEKKGEVAIPPMSARRSIFLTGTPIPNRPVEGWPLFHFLAPEEFRSFFGYTKRYCDANQNGYGWDFSGASNLTELQEKLRATIMIRRLKADVLTELPAKRRAIIEIAGTEAGPAVAAEQEAFERKEEVLLQLRAAVEIAKASEDPKDYADAVGRMQEAAQAAFTELARLRHATAIAKIPYVVEHLRTVTEAGSKVVCFAHHKDVINALEREFGQEAVSVYGETPMITRQANVDRFQSDPQCLVFIGGIQAAGVGLTLTAASHVVFAELDWVPGNMTQAEDRCHRIGQRDMVLVQHIVLEGSLDARMAAILVEKQEVIAEALDNSTDRQVPAVPSKEKAATENSSRAKIQQEAALLSPSQIQATHEALKLLADRCNHAATLDGAGFSRIDVMIGHSLANAGALTPRQAALGAKLARKYRRQLTTVLREAIGIN